MILDPGFINPDHIAHLLALVIINHLLLPSIRIKGTVSFRKCAKDFVRYLIDAFEGWLTQGRARVSAKSPTGEALKYIAKYWDGLCLFLTDGRVELDNNAVERTIRPIALNRKNALFAGHDTGAQNWAMIASLIETCKLNAVEPHAYLSGILTAIARGHRQANIKDLLPWNYVKSV